MTERRFYTLRIINYIGDPKWLFTNADLHMNVFQINEEQYDVCRQMKERWAGWL